MTSSELGVTRSTEATEVLLGAVRAGLVVLRATAEDHTDAPHTDNPCTGEAPRPTPDPRRVRVHLDAVLSCCADAAREPAPADAVIAVRTACDHLRRREIADAYFALHAARTVLTAALENVELTTRGGAGRS